MRSSTLLPAVALLLLAATLRAQDGDPLEARRLLFLLEYVGADYGAAVADGEVVNTFEFDEMLRFSAALVERFDVLADAGASPDTRTRLERLRALIAQRRPVDEVRDLVSTTIAELIDEVPLVTWPTSRPDLRRGALLYRIACAACHGPKGDGRGFGDPFMDPPPSSFAEGRMNTLSPHQVFGAMTFGIDGTAMPSYRETMPPDALWDIAFHVFTLRAGFDPTPYDPELGLSLEELAVSSNRELLLRLEREGRPAMLADVDHYRRTPPPFRLPESVVARTTRAAATDAAARVATDGHAATALDLAVALQDAFSAVADAVEPSVVSVTAFVRDEAAYADALARSGGPAWTGTQAEAHMYAGFRRLRSASGFFVSADGYLLTSYSALLADDGDIVDAIDVELPDGRHVLSRFVGGEPTVDLGILQLEVVSQARPPTITPAPLGRSDGVRVGHWMIALGNPWGPERTFSVGILAAPPQRECYQGELSATLMQSSLTIHPESHGGPLADIYGRVVGMTVPAPGAVVGLAQHGTEYALPIDLALNLYSALKVAESRRSPWLGFSVLELAAARRGAGVGGKRPSLPLTGVFIDDVFAPSPAASADIRIGDSLVAIDGNKLLSVLDFQKWLYLSGISRTVDLELWRDGESLHLPVTIEERPAEAVTR